MLTCGWFYLHIKGPSPVFNIKWINLSCKQYKMPLRRDGGEIFLMYCIDSSKCLMLQQIKSCATSETNQHLKLLYLFGYFVWKQLKHKTCLHVLIFPLTEQFSHQNSSPCVMVRALLHTFSDVLRYARTHGGGEFKAVSRCSRLFISI